MIVLSNIRQLYDGKSSTKSSVHRNVDLAIEAGCIAGLAPHATKKFQGEKNKTVDASDWEVTPGLVDCHGHITALGFRQDQEALMNSSASLLMIEKILYKTLVEGGVTTMRDIGGATNMMKRLVDQNVILGPRLKVAICMLSTTGGHADHRGFDRCHAAASNLWPPIPGRPSNIVDGPWNCRKRVREVVACGADLIKICASPGIASPGDKLENRDFSNEEVQAICDEAEGRGVKVAAHAHSKAGIALAIRNGVKDIQHISFLDERLTEEAFEKGCTVTPTSWVIHELLQTEGLSSFVIEKAKQAAEHHQKSVGYASKGGLRILMGTDPVLPGMHGRNYRELAFLVQDGLSALQTWHGSTGLAASEIGQTDAGTLELGKRADLLVCRGNVIDHPESINEKTFLEVIKDGFGYRGAIKELPQRSFQTTLENLWDQEFRAES